jgi:acetyl coenzyme A synthetase (ADP forming)-like protein
MLEQFFSPRTIAVIGASREEKSAGQGILKSLLSGGVFQNETNVPFKGKVFPVNPNADEILGLRCYHSLKEIKDQIDLAVIVVPAKIVPIVMKECADKKVKGAIVISAGFSEIGTVGKELENQVLEIARKAKIRIIGPNCLGVIRPPIVNASFGPCMPLSEDVAFFSQSGALIDSVIDWSLEENYGFSAVVSLGNKIDVDIPELLEWAAEDEKTKSIALYIEGLKDGRKFMEVARKVSRKKPIVALKAGRSASGMKAVSSHTGSIAGEYSVYKAAFKQAGVHLAESVDELFEMAEALAKQPPCKNNIAIVTNGGGAGVLCADHCEELGIKLADLSEKTLKRLDESGKMHPAYSRKNPLDLVGDALHDRYVEAIDAMLSQEDVAGLIVIQTLQTMTETMLDAEAVINAKKKFPNKPIITSYMGGKFSRKAVDLLEANNVPDFNVPYKAAKAMRALIDQKLFLER